MTALYIMKISSRNVNDRECCQPEGSAMSGNLDVDAENYA